VTEDDRYLVITAANSTYGNELYIKDLTKPNSPIVTIVDNFKSDNNIIENEGGKLFIETDLNAPNKRIVTVDVNNPNQKTGKTSFQKQRMFYPSTGGGYFANYMKDAVSLVKQYDYSGKLIREIKLPGVGKRAVLVERKKRKPLFLVYKLHHTGFYF
jgi:prolyl oligopeptidase